MISIIIFMIMLNILLIADIVSKIISLVIFVCLAMWSIRNLMLGVHWASASWCQFAPMQFTVAPSVANKVPSGV